MLNVLHVEMGKTTKRKAPQPISLAANSKATKRKKNKKSVVVRTRDEPVAKGHVTNQHKFSTVDIDVLNHCF